MHPSQEALLKYFNYDHLPDSTLRSISMKFCNLAYDLVDNESINDGSELTVALRKLLEAKDCAVRSVLP